MAWRNAKSLVRLRDQINLIAPSRSKANDGTIGDAAHASRSSDHNPWVIESGVGVVTAIDITNDATHGCNAQALVDALVRHRDPRIKYIIWNSKIVSSSVQPWIWRTYNGVNPHSHHFHLSVKPSKEHYDSVAEWNLS